MMELPEDVVFFRNDLLHEKIPLNLEVASLAFPALDDLMKNESLSFTISLCSLSLFLDTISVSTIIVPVFVFCWRGKFISGENKVVRFDEMLVWLYSA